MKPAAYFAGIGLCFVACACHTLDPDSYRPHVRIINGSDRTFDAVFVGFPKQDVAYGRIAPGEVSDYVPVFKAYRYAYVKVLADDKEFVIQPFDYVGEKKLTTGYHTYILNFSADGQSLDLTYECDGPLAFL